MPLPDLCGKLWRPLVGNGRGYKVDCPCVLQRGHQGPCEHDMTKVREARK